MLSPALKLLNPEERKAVWRYAFLVGVSALYEALSVLTVLPFLFRISQPQAPGSALEVFLAKRFFLGDLNQILVFLGVFSIVVILSANVLAAITLRKGFRLFTQLETALTGRFFQWFYSKDYEWMLGQDPAAMKRVLSQDTADLIADSVVGPMIALSKALGALLALLAMAVLKPMETMTVAGTLAGLYAIALRLLMWESSKLAKQRRMLLDRRDRFIYNIVTGMREIKLNQLGSLLSTRLMRATHEASEKFSRHQTITHLPKYIIESIGHTVLLSAVLVQIMRGRDGLEMLPFIGTSALISYRLLPAIQAAYTLIMQRRLRAPLLEQALKRLADSSSSPSLERISNDQLALPFPLSIELRGVSYSYPDRNHPAVRNIQLRIGERSRIGFVGENGSGKSTVLSLLLGLLHPQQGSIALSNHILDRQTAPLWWNQVGIVAQNLFFLDGTVAENIALWKTVDESQQARMHECAKRLGAHDFILRLPHGYDTVIGNAGTALSGGQKQLIGLCRALYRQPRVLLLDEATSALDPEAERKVCDVLFHDPNIGVIAIASHRLSTLVSCDRIYVLKHGEIQAEGTFNELSNSDALFKRFLSVSPANPGIQSIQF